MLQAAESYHQLAAVAAVAAVEEMVEHVALMMEAHNCCTPHTMGGCTTPTKSMHPEPRSFHRSSHRT